MLTMCQTWGVKGEPKRHGLYFHGAYGPVAKRDNNQTHEIEHGFGNFNERNRLEENV